MLLENVFPPDVRVEKEIRTLVGAGHTVHLLCYRYSRETPAEDQFAGASIHRMRVSRSLAKAARAFELKLPLYRTIWTSGIMELVRRFDPDVIHVHDLPPALPAAYAIDRLEGRRPRLLLDLHENYPDLLRTSTFATEFPQRLFFRYADWYALERQMTRRADHLVVASEDNGERIRREHEPTNPMTVVPNYVPIDEFGEVTPGNETRAFFRDDLINLLYVGGIDPSRGLDTVVDGLALAYGDGLRFNLVVVGSGSYEQELAQRVEAQGLTESVRFAGQVSQTRVWEFIACADICLLPLKPTIHGQQADPNKLYQYAYLEKPVLAADMAHLGRRLREMDAGVTYPPDDARGFARSLAELAANDRQRSEYGRRGHAAVKARFNWDVSAKALLDAYRQLT